MRAVLKYLSNVGFSSRRIKYNVAMWGIIAGKVLETYDITENCVIARRSIFVIRKAADAEWPHVIWTDITYDAS